MERCLREDSKLPAEGWSYPPVRAMVPMHENWDSLHYALRSRGQEGLMCTNITTALPDEMNQCGIYEWKLERKKDKQHKVVYVGSTCRAKPGSLRARVLQYCTGGSHKKDLINEALRKGYELHVRVKTSGQSKVAAEEMENGLLDTYNYAWNVRKNGIRDVVNCKWTVTEN